MPRRALAHGSRPHLSTIELGLHTPDGTFPSRIIIEGTLTIRGRLLQARSPITSWPKPIVRHRGPSRILCIVHGDRRYDGNKTGSGGGSCEGFGQGTDQLQRSSRPVDTVCARKLGMDRLSCPRLRNSAGLRSLPYRIPAVRVTTRVTIQPVLDKVIGAGRPWTRYDVRRGNEIRRSDGSHGIRL